MALNRIDPGTRCTISETGEKGILKKIYFYPTKYEIEFPDGKIKHYSTQDLNIDGLERPAVKKIASDIPGNGIGEMGEFEGNLVLLELLKTCYRTEYLQKSQNQYKTSSGILLFP